MKRKIFSIILLLLMALNILGGCSAPSLFLVGLVQIDIDGKNAAVAKKEMLAYVDEFEKKLSTHLQSSDVYKINQAKVGEEIRVSELCKELLQFSYLLEEKTQGAFNIATFPATVLWGFAPNADFGVRVPPSNENVQKILPLLALSNFSLNGNIVTKNLEGAMLDLGGIAKGYLADKCLEIAKKHDIKSGIINISSNLYLIGRHSEGRPYSIGITPPRGEADYLMQVQLENISIAESGDFERYFMHEGKRYCHIIDSSTAMPIDNGMMSVTIINASSMLCDVYATAGFVFGAEKAISFFESENIQSVISFERNGKKYYATTGDFSYSNVNGAYQKWID